MKTTPEQQTACEALVDRILTSYQADDRTQHIDASFLPSRDKAIQVLELLRRLVFPGFFDEQRVTSQTVRFHVTDLVDRIRTLLYEQVRQALHYDENRTGTPASGSATGKAELCAHCDAQADSITSTFIECIPELRRLLALDVQAAYDGDPAAVSTDETIFCYPGLYAIFVHRVAHELYKLKVPLLPRIMSEHAHSRTGTDIHPGAEIGESFFIDHATGVVIGETSVIGNGVQIYQGVTLGALAPKDAQTWRARKRHPTIEDNVTIYPNATILGGNTVIGRGCTINGSVFLTQSVPPNHTVRVRHPQPELQEKRARRPKRGDK